MEQLDMLWEYQNLDLKMAEYDEVRMNSPLRHKLIELKNYLMKQQAELLKLNDEADRRNNSFSRINHEYESIVSAFNADYEKIENDQIKNIKQLEQIKKTALDLQERLTNKEDELNKLLDDVQSLSKELDDIKMRIAKAMKEYSDIKIEYDKEVKKNQREYLKVRAKRDKLGKKIDGSLLKRYNSLKDSHNVAIIMCEDERCGGCNMTLAALVVQRLKEKQRIIECENCGRILYLGKN